MGRAKRKQIVMTMLGMLMVMSIALNFRLWNIDYRVSSHDTEILRREFDLANREAMDESAEWRRRYDLELEKSARCYQELENMKKSSRDTSEVSTDQSNKMKLLQKDNEDLLVRIESLKQELDSEKVRCRTRHNL